MNVKNVIGIVVHCWGNEKMIKSILISIATGIVAFCVCACTIPSKPYDYISIEEKENDNYEG